MSNTATTTKCHSQNLTISTTESDTLLAAIAHGNRAQITVDENGLVTIHEHIGESWTETERITLGWISDEGTARQLLNNTWTLSDFVLTDGSVAPITYVLWMDR